MNEHQENLLDHYSNPRNFGVAKFEPSAKAKLENLSCGDQIEVSIKIEDDRISNISFIGEGCSIAIGAASQLFEQIKGKSVNDILNLELNYPEELIHIPLTISRKKCAALSLETLKAALNQYHKDKDRI